jgi:hypothetical protein
MAALAEVLALIKSDPFLRLVPLSVPREPATSPNNKDYDFEVNISTCRAATRSTQTSKLDHVVKRYVISTAMRLPDSLPFILASTQQAGVTKAESSPIFL